MTLQARDLSGVVVAHMNLSKSGFKHYRCDKNLVLCFHMTSMMKIMQCAKPGDNVTIMVKEGISYVTIIFGEGEEGKKDPTTEFYLREINITDNNIGIQVVILTYMKS